MKIYYENEQNKYKFHKRSDPPFNRPKNYGNKERISPSTYGFAL